MNLRGQKEKRPLEELFKYYILLRDTAWARATARYLRFNKFITSLVRKV